MTEITQPLDFVVAKKKNDSPDILQGIALLGILLINIVGFAIGSQRF